MELVYETSFEDGFYDYENIGELTVPIGWVPAWDDVLYARPEYDQKYDTPEVRTGHFAATLGLPHHQFDGVLQKDFYVGNAERVKVTVWVYGESHEEGDPVPKGLGMQIGVAVQGTHFLEGGVIWSDWIAFRENSGYEEKTWYESTLDTYSPGEEITVYLRGKADWPVDVNAAHWDDFKLETEGDGATPPPSGGLGDYITAQQASIDKMQDDLDGLKEFIESGAIRALPV